MLEEYEPYINRYHGRKWLKAELPDKAQPWILGPYAKSIIDDKDMKHCVMCDVEEHLETDSWQWPDRVIYFFSDMHADTDAFFDSLIASGGIKKYGPKDRDFKLTKEGKKARFILGGDCFDKGPSTLRLLRVIKLVIDKGGDVVILAGNHDTRTLLGILSLIKRSSVSREHFFVRMGLKPLPLFKEINDEYLGKKRKKIKVPSIERCRKKIFPSEKWYREFPAIAHQLLSESAVKKEMGRTLKKMEKFEDWGLEHGLTLRHIYAAALKWRDLFLDPKGEFYWFFDHLQLASKEGSFFFVHAGVGDTGAKMIRKLGVKGINKKFRKLLKKDLFTLYYGTLGNMFRTKYRDTDRQFTKKGKLMLNNAGINVIVHGHQHLNYGQRMMVRKGMINFQCDTSLDMNTRKKEGLVGHGASVTIIRPEKLVLGICSDYPYIKVFEPSHTMALSKKMSLSEL